MEDQKLVIKGTVEGIIKILMKDFNMSPDEAKYFVYVMLHQQNKAAVNAISEEELNIWYLADKDRYEGQIFNTHLFISFTVVEKELQHLAYYFFTKWIFSRNIDLVSIGTELIYAVTSAISKIQDTDYCVFSHIVELCVGNKGKMFSIDDIQTKNKDGKCDYQETDWKCTYLSKNEDCISNKEKIRQTFSRLEEKGIIKKIGNNWILVR